jgi:thioesterase domain-containing protein
VAVVEFASRAGTEKDGAVRRAKDLEVQLETLKKESQDALAQAKADAHKLEEERRTRAAEHEEQLASRLRALADALSSTLLECEPAMLVSLPL